MVRTSLLLITMALAWPAGSAQASAQIGEAAAGSQAGTAGDARWLLWVGCWVPAARPGPGADSQVCIVPDDAAAGVRMITFAGDREILSETIVANGSGQPVPDQQCAGERATRWSQSGRRLFSTSTVACEGEAPLKTTAVASLISSDSWLDVQVTVTGGREQVRTRRFWRSSSTPPAPLVDVLARLGSPQKTSVAITADDVIEASGHLPPAGVEAWLVESGMHVPIDRRTLVRLSDAHVAENVIDLMIGLAFPRKFEVRRAAASGGGALFGGTGFDVFLSAETGSWFDYAGFGWWGPAYCCYGGYFPWDGWYDTPDEGGGGGGSTGDVTHGQVVNGKGYTRVQPREAERRTGSGDGGRTSAADGSSGNSGSQSSGDSSSSSGASPAGYSGGGGTSTGLTAVPR
jgi:hypothetical protein